jgi:hypothetical protein
MTGCERRAYSRALSGVRAFYRHMGFDTAPLPDWARSAMRQHARFFAREKCKGR